MNTLQFCSECNCTMCPKEDKEERILLYACSNCDHQEVAKNSCVYEKRIHHPDDADSQEFKDVIADPSLPRTKNVRCAYCNHGEAVFFQAPVKGEVSMALFFICCKPSCGHRWRD